MINSFTPSTLLGRNKLDFLIEMLYKSVSVPGVIIEVGVFQGGSLFEIAQRIGGAKRVIGYDTFRGLPKPTAEDLVNPIFHREGEFYAREYLAMQEFFKKHHTELVIVEFPNGVDPMPISFCHLDIDFYLGTKKSLQYLSENMTTNGIVVVDDFGWAQTPGVAKAIEEFLSEPSCRFSVLQQSLCCQLALIKKD